MPSNDKPASKFNVNFPGTTNVGHQQIGDVHTNNYNPVSNMTISINGNYIEQMPEKYRTSLVQFVEKVNEEIQKENVSHQLTAQFQTKINELAETTTELKESEVSEEKKTIHDRLRTLAKSLVKMSPTIARTVVGFTPLAPFSNLVGETFEAMIQDRL
jgi:hypothetical protein